MDKEIIKCPICEEKQEAEECTFATTIKTEDGEDMLCCCPTQAKRVKNE